MKANALNTRSMTAALVALALTGITAGSALANDVPLAGDINGDAIVNIQDVQCTVLTVLWDHSGTQDDAPGCTGDDPFSADLSCDGRFAVQDIMIVAYNSLGIALSDKIDANGDDYHDACGYFFDGSLTIDFGQGIPLGEDSSACCDLGETDSCDADNACKSCVCEADSFCCDVEWDAGCDEVAGTQCADTCACE